MDGSGNKRGGDGLPLVTPQSSRRRTREDNPNQQNLQMPVEPQPQQAEGGGQMEPADQRARLANRRYSEAFRHRRQNHVQQLEALTANLEAQQAQLNQEVLRMTTERSEILSQNDALRRRRDAFLADCRAEEAETQTINENIERIQKEMEADDQEMENLIMNDPYYAIFEGTFSSVIDSVTPPFLGNPPLNPPADDEAGSSGTKDSSSDDSI